MKSGPVGAANAVTLGIIKAVWLSVVLVVAVVELAVFRDDALVLVLVAAGLVACGFAFGGLLGPRAAVPRPVPAPTAGRGAVLGERQTMVVDGHLGRHSVQAGSGSGDRDVISVPPPAAMAPASPARSTGDSSYVPTPPVFGNSVAHRAPWRLPTRLAASGVSADAAQVGALAVRAASIVGAGHRCEEPATPRQDAYQLGRDRSGQHLVIAVADGISSARHSDVGAAAATRAAVAHLVRLLDAGATVDTVDQHRDALFGGISEQMRAKAAAEGLREQDVSSVLILGVIQARPEASGRHGAWLAWLGDVSVWGWGHARDERWNFYAGERKSRPGELETGELHHYLPRHPRDSVSTLIDLPTGGALTFVTDGVGDVLNHAPTINSFLAGRWAAAPPIASYVNDLSFEVKGQQDDRTAVTVWAGGDVKAGR